MPVCGCAPSAATIQPFPTFSEIYVGALKALRDEVAPRPAAVRHDGDLVTTVGEDRRAGLEGQTVVVIGGSAGIGLETARQARSEGADVILTGRTRDRLQRAAPTSTRQSTATFDANDLTALEGFFAGSRARSTT